IPDNIEPLFILECNDIHAVEKCIKDLLKPFQYRKRKEIFRVDFDIIKEAIVRCDDLYDSFQKYLQTHGKKITAHKINRLQNSEYGFFIKFGKNIDIYQ